MTLLASASKPALASPTNAMIVARNARAKFCWIADVRG
jgi:hypothetical protein